MVKRDSHESDTSNQKMTVAKPFDFQTAKRIRIQNQIDAELLEDGDGSKSQVKEDKYEPLCQQLERNFKLRASEEKTKDDGKPRKLTRPISPNLQIE